MTDPAYFDLSYTTLDNISYLQAFEDPRPLTHDEELLGELPTEERRAVIRARDIELFFRWLRLAKPSARTLYHVGELDRDRVTDPTANLLSHVALRAETLGLVWLFQTKSGLFEREYTAQRSRRPCNAGHLATLRELVANPPPPLIPPQEHRPGRLRRKKTHADAG